MRILHVIVAEKSKEALASLRAAVEGNASVLAHMAMRLSKSSGLSIVFANQNSLDRFLPRLDKCLDGNRPFETLQFEISPDNLFDRPVIILGAPRSGTTLLFETLGQCPDLWTIGGESHAVIEPHGSMPGERGHRLEALDADSKTCQMIKSVFISVLRDRSQNLYLRDCPAKGLPFRFLEKTPRNALRVPFLRAVFPDCRFIFLYRDPGPNIGSILDGWYAPDRFISYQLDLQPWKFLLPPGWPALVGRPFIDIAAAQWKASNNYILRDLEEVPSRDWCLVRYENIISDSAHEVRRLCDFASLEMDGRVKAYLEGALPLSRTTLTAPDPAKWRRHADSITEVLPSLREIEERVCKLENKLGQ